MHLCDVDHAADSRFEEGEEATETSNTHASPALLRSRGNLHSEVPKTAGSAAMAAASQDSVRGP